MRSTRPLVVIDPGHGGDSLVGTSTPNRSVGPGGEQEKDVVLDIGKATCARLAGVADVHLTRADDRNVALEDRARLAARLGADAFVSLHLDRHPDPNVDGARAFVAPWARPQDRDLAHRLAASVGVALGTSAAVERAPLEVLDGRHHVARTAACQVELAHLTNPSRARWITTPDGVAAAGAAVAAGIAAFLAETPAPTALSALPATIVLDRTTRHPDGDSPLPGAGEDRFDLDVPEGEQFAGYDVDVTATTPGAGYDVRTSPPRGSTGHARLEIRWWHLPFGRIDYRVRAWSSRDGLAPPVRIDIDAPGWDTALRDAVAQGRGTEVVVHGWKGEALAAAAQRLTVGDQPAQQEPVTITIAILVAACFAVGVVALALIAHQAMEKGYTMRDAGVSAGIDPATGGTSNTFGFTLEPPR